MKAVLALIIAMLALCWIVPILRGLWRGARRVVVVMPVLLAAMIAGVPMIVHPDDLPVSWQPWSPLDLDASPNLVSRWKVRLLPLRPDMCRAALGRAGGRQDFLPDAIDSEHCHILNRVKVSGLSRARLSPVSMRCEMAARLYLWEKHELQPIAERVLGSRVARIEHFSSYSCRKMRTSRGGSSRWSQHATANAFDIAGFVLEDGRSIRLPRDWGHKGRKAVFLYTVRDSLCASFNVTLSPDYNRLHADHFHVDMGPFLSCR